MCDIFIKPRYHFWSLFKLQGAHHEIYKATGVYIGKKKIVFKQHTFGQFFGLKLRTTFFFPIDTPIVL
jgi:hypothetical protein